MKKTEVKKPQGKKVDSETANQYHLHFLSAKLQKQNLHSAYCFSSSILAAERDKSMSVNIDFMMKTCIIDEGKGTLELKSSVLPCRTFHVRNFVTH